MSKFSNNGNPEFRVNIPKHEGGLHGQRIHVSAGSGGMDIMPEGYGEHTSEDGFGAPIFIESTEEGLRLLVWSDINDENPTHIINLEGARETARNDK